MKIYCFQPQTNSILKIKNVTTYCYNEKFKPETNPFGLETSVVKYQVFYFKKSIIMF